MCERWPRLLAASVIAVLLAPPALLAQAGLGHVDDPGTPPAGLLRLRALTAWTRFESRFTGDTLVPLGAPWTSPALGPREIPALTGVESLVRSTSGSAFTLSLGQSRLNAVARDVIIPLGLEYGVTNRLSVGVTVPIVQRRSTLLFLLDSTGANVGPNPHRTSSAASQLNNQVQAEFANAIAQLQQRLQTCQNTPTAPGCSSLAGREAEAQQLIQVSQSFASDVAALFGSGASAGAAFVPRAQSAAQADIGLRIADFNTRYRDLLAANVDLLRAVPAAAGGPAGSAELRQYVIDELGRDSLNTQERLGIGDVEIGAKFRFVDAPPSETRRIGVRAAAAAAVRLPTGSRLSPTEVADLRLGAGVVVADSRLLIDAQAGRFGVLAAGHLAVAVTRDAQATDARDRRWVEVHVAPRFHFSGPMAIHGAYSLRSADVSGGDQLVGGGVSFSTLAQYRSGRGVPIEMRFTHLEALTGDAGRPKLSRDQIEVRLYYRLRR